MQIAEANESNKCQRLIGEVTDEASALFRAKSTPTSLLVPIDPAGTRGNAFADLSVWSRGLSWAAKGFAEVCGVNSLVTTVLKKTALGKMMSVAT